MSDASRKSVDLSTAGVMHDLNNLLAAVVGAADALAARDGLDAAARDDLVAIQSAATHAGALARSVMQPGELQPCLLAVHAELIRLAAILRHLLPRSVQLVVQPTVREYHAWMDPPAFGRVLLNLLGNSGNAMPGGGTITLRSDALTLGDVLVCGARIVPPGEYVLVEVADTGPGIPPDILPHVFDPLFTTRLGRGGTGLGLAIVVDLMQRSQGFVTLESQPGAGTQVRLYLPRRPSPDSLKAARSPSAAASARRGNILLVDDDPVLLRLTERMLRGCGWDVVAASSAEAAFERLPGAVDAVIADLSMPGVGGAALIAALRERLKAPRLPAICISGFAATRMRHEVERALGTADDTDSVVRYLTKPFSTAELLAALDDMLADD